MATAKQGAYSRLFVGNGATQLTYTAATCEAYEFITESLQATRAVLDTGGIRGERSVPKERTRLGIRSVNGSIVMNPSPLDLDKWLPRILGAAEAANVFNLGDTFTAFGIFLDRDNDNYEYINCFVSRATFRAQAGGLVEMTLDIVGGDEFTGLSDPGSPPTIGVTAADAPYVFHDSCGALALPSVSSAEMFDMTIVIDNMMDPRFVNCVTATSIVATDRIVTVGLTVPFDATHKKLYRGLGTDRASSGNVTFTNGSYSTKFDFISLDGPDITPNVAGKTEVGLRLEYRARKAGATAEVIVTNVSA